MVAEISTKIHLNEYTSDPSKLTVIDFTASWCPPCQAIKPVFEDLAKNNTHVNFIKVDLSEGTNELAASYSVTAMPTFIFLVGGDEVHRIRGANPSGLKSAITQYAKPAPSGAFSGQGRTLSGKGGSSSSGSTYNASNSLTTTWSNMNPQAKVLIVLCVAYAFFWLI
ncbi:thioredoxin-domain-containing protein [Suillus clintonianus]|uniref:thioredoxin-domain-containing protein n=1 Tax=Suillus clintonianus TaxID=1904413 RepID=UPI001B86B2C7|nr:thioredoxin-domain-containing protein [Suillus clintonianus]KAG2140638.1 thioredoxin-domain-containing protein [Suillus clintonianus]